MGLIIMLDEEILLLKFLLTLEQGGASLVDHLCYFCLVFCYTFVRVCLLMPCGHMLGKGLPLGSLVCEV